MQLMYFTAPADWVYKRFYVCTYTSSVKQKNEKKGKTSKEKEKEKKR